MLRVAVIGTGTMGKDHLAAWESLPVAEVTAVYGRNLEKASRLAMLHRASAFDDMDALLAAGNIDAVDICLPTDIHRPIVEKAAAAGKHIFCEKPLALNEEEARDMIALCEQSGVRLFVCHDLRFCPEYRQARRLVQSGKLGRIGIVRLSRRSRFPVGSGSWYADSDRSGGVLMDLLIHEFDWIRWTFGEVRRVTALRTEQTNLDEPLDYALVVLRMESGVLIHVEGSWAHTEFGSSLEITGSEGMLVENLSDSMPLTLNERSGPGMLTAVAVPDMSLQRSSYERELLHFTKCLLSGEEPEVTAHDAMKAIAIARAAIQSAQTGVPVKLNAEEVQSLDSE